LNPLRLNAQSSVFNPAATDLADYASFACFHNFVKEKQVCYKTVMVAVLTDAAALRHRQKWVRGHRGDRLSVPLGHSLC
jgi:hypothetical protein